MRSYGLLFAALATAVLVCAPPAAARHSNSPVRSLSGSSVPSLGVLVPSLGGVGAVMPAPVPRRPHTVFGVPRHASRTHIHGIFGPNRHLTAPRHRPGAFRRHGRRGVKTLHRGGILNPDALVIFFGNRHLFSRFSFRSVRVGGEAKFLVILHER